MEAIFIKYLGSLEDFLNNHKEFDENYNEKYKMNGFLINDIEILKKAI